MKRLQHSAHSRSVSAADARGICGHVILNKCKIAALRCINDVWFACNAGGGGGLQWRVTRGACSMLETNTRQQTKARTFFSAAAAWSCAFLAAAASAACTSALHRSCSKARHCTTATNNTLSFARRQPRLVQPSRAGRWLPLLRRFVFLTFSLFPKLFALSQQSASSSGPSIKRLDRPKIWQN